MNFRGERRSNATHRSVTDPDARLTRKSSNTAALLGYVGSVLMDNRHGLVVATDVRSPSYEAERDAALALVQRLEPRARRRTVGADKGYDIDAFVDALRRCHLTPHISPNVHAPRRRSAIDRRTTLHPGYAVSQRKTKRVEEIFGWDTMIGLVRKLGHEGRDMVGWVFTFTNAVYNLVRLRTLIAAEAGA